MTFEVFNGFWICAMVSRVCALLPCVCVWISISFSVASWTWFSCKVSEDGHDPQQRRVRTLTVWTNHDQSISRKPLHVSPVIPIDSYRFFCNLCASRCAFMWVPDTSFCFSLTQTCINLSSSSVLAVSRIIPYYTHHLRILKAFLRWLPLPRFRSGDELNLP